MKALWDELAPWLRCLVAAVTGGTVIVLAPLVAKQALAMFSGGPMVWPAWYDLRLFWAAASLVVGLAYWAKSPKGRDIWTDEQRQAVKDALKDKSL